MKTSFTVLLLLLLLAQAPGQNIPTSINTVKEGVYLHQARFFPELILLELTNGQFRFWHGSRPAGPGDYEKPSYPVSGTYSTNGGTITYVAKSYISKQTVNGVVQSRDHYTTNTWTFMKYQGQTTLWNSTALRAWDEGRRSSRGVLFLTNNNPEVIWAGRRL